MPQISLYVQDSLAKKLAATAKMHNCSVSKYVASVLSARLCDAEDSEEGKRAGYRRLAGALKGDPLEEPDEIPWEVGAARRFDLL